MKTSKESITFKKIYLMWLQLQRSTFRCVIQ